MTIYSYTRLTAFDSCPLKYKYTYIDREEKDFKTTIEGFMGTKVHETLEYLYKQVKYKKILSLTSLKRYYNNLWKNHFHDEIKKVKEELTYNDYKKLGEKYIENYYKKHYPFDEDYTIGLEQEVELDLFNDGKYIIKGYIDRLAIKDNILRIHDYKTSNTLPTNEEINSNKQLAIYALALKNKYPNVEKIELIWHFLAFDQEIKITKTEENYDKLKKELKDKIDFLENLKEEDFIPKKSILCNWCQYQSKCPLFKHIIKSYQTSLEEFSKDYGYKLAKDYELTINELEKLKLKQKELEEKIIKYALKENIYALKSDNFIFEIVKTKTRSFPLKNSKKYLEIKDFILKNKFHEYLQLDNYLLVKDLNKELLPENLKAKIKENLTEKETLKIKAHSKYL